jgi:hypothetical protein
MPAHDRDAARPRGPGATPARRAEGTPTRRPYHSPALVRYGDLVDLTRASNAGMGNLDGEVVARMGKILLLKSF